jgi:hypothetical protein
MLARFTYREAYEIPLVPVRFPAAFCDACRHLTATCGAPETVPWDLCPECASVLFRGALFGSLHFTADGEHLSLLCRLWRDFLRNIEARVVASYCRPCHRAYVRREIVTEIAVMPLGMPKF